MRVRTKLTGASVLGVVFAFSTLIMIKFPVLPSFAAVAWVQRVLSILLFPGFFVGFAASGNIHAAHAWVVVLANFLVYFGLAWLALTVWEKFCPPKTRGE